MQIPNPDIFEPITYDTLHELVPGEWIWDNKLTERREHKRSLDNATVTEPIGFRQIDILDLDLYPQYSSKPFMLSGAAYSGNHTGLEWVYFELGRFYKFKKEKRNDQT